MSKNEPVGLKLLCIEDGFLAIHKEPGIPFQKTPDHMGVMQILRSMPDVPTEPRIFPVHRLDRVTSGILLFARGRQAANQLGNAFRHNRIQKVYIAISDRKPRKKQGTVSGDMQKGRRGSWILARTHDNPAITHFTSHALPGTRKGLRVYVLRPRTGKTHQLRVALKSISAPVLGDPLYSRFDLARAEDRTYLHATAIRFELDGKEYTVKDIPAPGMLFALPEFQKLYSSLGDLFKTAYKPQKKNKNPTTKPRA